MLGEISWRWSFGLALWTLVALSSVEYFRGLPVTPLSWLMWKTGLPPLMSQALSATIAGSGFKLVRIAAVLVPGYAVLWTMAHGFGRTATLQAMLPHRTVSARAMFGIGFLRAALMLMCVICLAGVFAIAARFYSDGPGTVPHPGRATTVLILGSALVCYLWTLVNWFLSLTPVLAALSGDDVIGSLSRALSALSQNKKKFFAVSSAFGSLHFLAYIVFTGIAFFSLALAGVLPGKVMLLVLLIVGLKYFAVADFLYMCRLAAYVSIISDADLALPPPKPAPVPPMQLQFRPRVIVR